jgi:mono/diheme cytochrome c family protein
MKSRPAVFAAAAVLGLAACGDSGAPPDPLAERGRQVYMSQCTPCHAIDPAQSGAIGPEVKGSSKALLESKILRGEYPPGYRPKRPTKVMPPMPALTPDIDGLAIYLR